MDFKPRLNSTELFIKGKELIDLFLERGTQVSTKEMTSVLGVDKFKINDILEFLLKWDLIEWDKQNPIIEDYKDTKGKLAFSTKRNIKITEKSKKFFAAYRFINSFSNKSKKTRNEKTIVLLDFCTECPEYTWQIKEFFPIKRTSIFLYTKELKKLGYSLECKEEKVEQKQAFMKKKENSFNTDQYSLLKKIDSQEKMIEDLKNEICMLKEQFIDFLNLFKQYLSRESGTVIEQTEPTVNNESYDPFNGDGVCDLPKRYHQEDEDPAYKQAMAEMMSGINMDYCDSDFNKPTESVKQESIAIEKPKEEYDISRDPFYAPLGALGNFDAPMYMGKEKSKAEKEEEDRQEECSRLFHEAQAKLAEFDKIPMNQRTSEQEAEINRLVHQEFENYSAQKPKHWQALRNAILIEKFERNK